MICLSFICPDFSGWAKILTLISWFKYRAFIIYILLFILWHRVILMIFGMHTSVVFTENRSIFKRGHSACNDSCLASHILPVLAFPYLFLPSFCPFILQYSSWFKSDCLLISPWILHSQLNIPCVPLPEMPPLLFSHHWIPRLRFSGTPPNNFAPKWAPFP